MPDRMPERRQDLCQKVCQNSRCQVECLIECQSICQKECQIGCQNIYAIYTSRWYVRNYARMVCQGGGHSKKVIVIDTSLIDPPHPEIRTPLVPPTWGPFLPLCLPPCLPRVSHCVSHLVSLLSDLPDCFPVCRVSHWNLFCRFVSTCLPPSPTVSPNLSSNGTPTLYRLSHLGILSAASHCPTLSPTLFPSVSPSSPSTLFPTLSPTLPPNLPLYLPLSLTLSPTLSPPLSPAFVSATVPLCHQLFSFSLFGCVSALFLLCLPLRFPASLRLLFLPLSHYATRFVSHSVDRLSSTDLPLYCVPTLF